LEIVDGKARVVKESFCDGLGACIGACPVDALRIEEREADSFDEEAVKKHLAECQRPQVVLPTVQAGGCPGSVLRQRAVESGASPPASGAASQLSHWPVQFALVPPWAPFLQDADVLLVADCVPFAFADFHQRFLRGRPVLIGCPKLDDVQPYVDKLAAIVKDGALRSLTVVHMEVPCCSGLSWIARSAMEAAGRKIPAREVTISVDGNVLSEGDL
jgi:ferredoxin